MVKEAFELGYQYGLMKAAAEMDNYWNTIYNQYGMTPEDYYAAVAAQQAQQMPQQMPEQAYNMTPQDYYGATPESYYGMTPEDYYAAVAQMQQQQPQQGEQLLGYTGEYPYQYTY
jgi:hypothetical protein